jgi:hypothetical protein
MDGGHAACNLVSPSIINLPRKTGASAHRIAARSRRESSYGKSFERNIGMSSPLKISGGLNDLWTRGGLMYAPPLRCARPERRSRPD